jgi:hypothetical protein
MGMLIPRRSLLLGGAASIVLPRRAAAFTPWGLIAHAGAAAVDNATTSAINTTGATMLIVGMVYTGTVTLTDSRSNTWASAISHTYGPATTAIFYSIAPAVGAGHTFTLSGTGIYAGLWVQAWGGASPAIPSPVDQTNAAINGAPTTVQAGPITPVFNNELIVAALGNQDSTSDSYTIDSGFTITDQSPGPPEYGGAAAYFVQATAATVNPTWTNSTTTGLMTAVIASFEVRSAGLHTLALTGAG